MKQKALPNKNVSFLRFLVVRSWGVLSVRGVINTLRLFRPHWSLQSGVDHGGVMKSVLKSSHQLRSTPEAPQILYIDPFDSQFLYFLMTSCHLFKMILQ